jgi:dephospho-CoA kinase
MCSEVWLVDCEAEQQLQRLMERDGLSAEEAQTRIDAQWPLQCKRALADRLIDNRNNVKVLNSQLMQLLNLTDGHKSESPCAGMGLS